MKKLLTIIMALACTMQFVYAQSMGNQKLNEVYRYQNQTRSPITQSVFGTSTGSNGELNENEIVLEVNALLNVKADSYVAVFNITQVGETSVEVNELTNARINGFVNALKTIGVDTSQIYIDMISLVPIYDYQLTNKIFSKSYNEVPTGFQMEKNIHIKYMKPEILDKIINLAVQSEIYDLIKVDYFINDTQKNIELLREKSIQFLSAKIKAYVPLGFKLDTVYKIMAEESQATYPISRYTSYQSFNKPSLEAAKKKAMVSSDIKFKDASKSTSMYYNPLPYDQYDIILNPVILEPMIQLSYNIKIKYTIKDQPKKQFMYITPQGEVKALNLK